MKLTKGAVVTLTVIGILAFILPPSEIAQSLTRNYRICASNGLSKSELQAHIQKADQGDKAAMSRLVSYFISCEKDNLDTMLDMYKKYQFFNNDSVADLMLIGMFEFVGSSGLNGDDLIKYGEMKATSDASMRIFLAYAYTHNDDLPNSLPKALYYSKLDGCEGKEPYAYASYLYTLFHNYADNKEYLKVTYAMLLFTKLNANQFYNYSNFESLEQNITSRLSPQDISYITANHNDILSKECEGIMSDHNLVPTEEKLIKYAFPLKSDDNDRAIALDE